MKLSTSLHQVQKQLLAPAMQQSIEMLMLPLAELNLSIDQEIQNNPLLEIDEEQLQSSLAYSQEEMLKSFEYFYQTQNFPWRGDTFVDDEILEERPIKMETCLEDELLQQLGIELSDPVEMKIGETIIGSLDEDGYLTATCEEIAQVVGIDDLVRVEYILKIIQNFEPIGIASRNLRECLLFQVKFRCNGRSKLVQTIIEDCLEELGHKRFQKIARRLGVSLDAVKEAARFISRFEPKPARNHRPIPANLYVKPDIFIKMDENKQYHIQINKDGIPPLRVSPKYRQMLRQNNLTDDEKQFIREKLKNALYFIKSIAQRGTTIQKIAEYILEKQKGFFDEGHTALVPMTLKDIARTIDRNESTVSRAVSHKYIDTPHGIFPLKFFFSKGICGNSENGNGQVASRSIKEEIKELIDVEDPSRPLSDAGIQDHFGRKGVSIARRTINKYRHTLRILPSHLRKN